MKLFDQLLSVVYVHLRVAEPLKDQWVEERKKDKKAR